MKTAHLASTVLTLLTLLTLAGCAPRGSSAPEAHPTDSAVSPARLHREAGQSLEEGPPRLPHPAPPTPLRDPNAPLPAREIVRFVVLGDGGTGSAAQYEVAKAIRMVCARRGCDFALYLGDNIYETGVSSALDSQFRTKFEDPYAELDFPFYVVLGNHDYGTPVPTGSPLERATSDFEIEYTAHSDKWNMPDHFYAFEHGPAAFFALDTNGLVHDFQGLGAEQQRWLDRALMKSQAPWKIVFGHHPYISNGSHGSAGNFDGLGQTPQAPNGATLAALIEHSVCGKAQIYFAGHNHAREWLEPTCGTTFIVSGAAAKLSGLWYRGSRATRYEDDTKLGFLWAEIDREQFLGVFYDADGREAYRDLVVRPSAP